MQVSVLRAYDGPAFLSAGFRPFFFFGALFSGLSMILWLPQFYGELALSTEFIPVDWHIHELYFGFLPAIITGFLLTAVPNWTGRLPICGGPLLLLVCLWVVGRLAIGFSAYTGWLSAMLIDVSFLMAIAMTISREIIAGKNWRNLKVLVPVILLTAANLTFHLEVHFHGVSDISRRLASTAVIALIMIIGGRIIPSFTRNWLTRENPGRLPAQFSRFDIASLGAGLIGMGSWVCWPESKVTGFVMAMAALFQFGRLCRWAGYRTVANPLITIMHVSYLFIPIGFSLLAASIVFPDVVPQIAGVHALGAGAMGGMTLSMMVRVTLGHTGRPLYAGKFICFLFGCVLIAVLARIMAALNLGHDDSFLHLAAFAWLFAFAGFAISFATAVFSPRQ